MRLRSCITGHVDWLRQFLCEAILTIDDITIIDITADIYTVDIITDGIEHTILSFIEGCMGRVKIEIILA